VAISSALSTPLAFCLPLLDLMLAKLDCTVRVSSPLPLEPSCLSVPSVTEALSGVGMAVESSLLLVVFSDISAFTRIRRECSNTSCVMIPSVRTSVLVYNNESDDSE
jgi:hypothetical protein